MHAIFIMVALVFSPTPYPTPFRTLPLQPVPMKMSPSWYAWNDADQIAIRAGFVSHAATAGRDIRISEALLDVLYSASNLRASGPKWNATAAHAASAAKEIARVTDRSVSEPYMRLHPYVERDIGQRLRYARMYLYLARGLLTSLKQSFGHEDSLDRATDRITQAIGKGLDPPPWRHK